MGFIGRLRPNRATTSGIMFVWRRKKMRKKGLVAVIFVIALWMGLRVECAEFKSAYVDLQEIFGKTGLSADFMEQFRKEQEILREREQEVVEFRKKLEAQRSILNPKELKKQEELLQKKLLELRKFARDKQEKLEKIKTENFAAIRDAVKKIAQSEGIGIVFEKGVVIFCENPMDLTQKVIDSYKKKER